MTYRVHIALGPAFVADFAPVDVDDSTILVDGLTYTSDPADPIHVLDGLSMSWRHSSEELHAPLDPLQASLRVTTRDVGLLGALKLGDLAAVQLKDATGVIVGAVYGRVGDLSATQERRWSKADQAHVLWTTYQVTILDHTVSSDEPVDVTLPADLALSTVLEDIEVDSGILIRDVPYTVGGRQVFGTTGVARDTDDTGAVTLIREYLPWFPVTDESDGSPYPVRGVLQLAPIADPDTGELVLLSLHVNDFRITNPVVLPASQVDLTGTWRRAPAESVNLVVVKMDQVGANPKVKARARAADWSSGDATIRRTIDLGTLLKPSTFHAEHIAELYLGESV